MTLEDPFLPQPLPPFQAFGIDLPKARTGALAVVLAALAVLALAPVVLVIRLVSLASEAAALLQGRRRDRRLDTGQKQKVPTKARPYSADV